MWPYAASARQRSSSVGHARGGADGEFAVLDAALDSVAPSHQSGEAEMDSGPQRIVALSLHECFAVERHRRLRVACLDAGQMRHDGCALGSGRGGCTSLLE